MKLLIEACFKVGIFNDEQKIAVPFKGKMHLRSVDLQILENSHEYLNGLLMFIYNQDQKIAICKKNLVAIIVLTTIVMTFTTFRNISFIYSHEQLWAI